ncbi:Thioredoxin II, putative [Ricinus communis]|uniref:Thioredoxin II, putative n=1 Tax=Ricinus communis TaxID=3988 RepID=B9RLX0_RICCO|nr:Thioredoxin II, putative [Ricinus communis]|eukprot:XP_002514739.1 thioredoxin-like 1-2, chloroplastic [Ricinus communis]
MACSLKSTVNVSGLKETIFSSKTEGVFRFCQSFGVIQIGESKSKSKDFPVLSIDFKGKPLVLSDQKGGFEDWSRKTTGNSSVQAQASICVSRAMRWWEKTLKPNMVEIHSAQELAESLLNAGDRLVIVDFYSPGCGGCKALHPKICQLAESNPDAIFLKVNYEELKTMCQSLHIHVLPFFRFYRGADGRLCSFSCTNATIKKFKDALAKHGKDRCSLSPARGLEESEILTLASVGELPINLPLQSTNRERVEDMIMKNIDLSGVWGNKTDLKEGNAIGV